MKYLRRLYWRIKFWRLSEADKELFIAMGIDPNSLIERGEL